MKTELAYNLRRTMACAITEIPNPESWLISDALYDYDAIREALFGPDDLHGHNEPAYTDPHLLWMVYPSMTELTILNKQAETFSERPDVRYDFVRRGYKVFLSPWNPGHCKIYHITRDNFTEVTLDQAANIARDVIAPVINEWVAENGPLPVDRKVEVRFPHISLRQIINDIKADPTLLDCLRRFRNTSRKHDIHYISVSYDKSENVYYFSEHVGGSTRLCGAIHHHDTGWLRHT